MKFIPPLPTADTMRFWCDAMRDDNAIHLDPKAAAEAGFGERRVNPGPANLALLINAWMADTPDQYPARIEATFLGNVFEGDALGVRATAPDSLALFRADDAETNVLQAIFHPKAEPE